MHDQRFARGFLDHGIGLGLVSLQSSAVSIAVESGTKVDFVRSLGLEGQLDGSTTESLVKEYVKLEKEFAPEVVLAGPLSDCAYIKALAGTHVPFVAQSWAFDVMWEAKYYDEKRSRCVEALQKCSGLFADCDAVVRECEELVLNRIAESLVLPWGLEHATELPTCTREEERSRLQLGGKHVFLYTRGLEQIYSVETLLHAFKILHDGESNAVLVMASGGSLKNDVERAIRQAGMEKVIIQLGPLPHRTVLELFCLADFYVSCSLSDGTSVSLLEAMRAGLIPIVSDVGGNREWVEDGRNGWLTRAMDPSSLAMAMHDALVCGEDRKRQMVAVNRRLVEQRANWERNMEGLVAFLDIM